MKKLLIALMALALLAACSPTSQGTESFKGYLTIQDGRLIEYQILIPRSWIDNETFEYRKDGNTNYFDYSASPKHTLFVIAAFTEARWQEVRKELGQHSEELFSREGIVIVCNVALDNPYTGVQAEEFQRMAEEVRKVVHSLSVLKISTSAAMEEAHKVLITFFDQLSVGNYAAAAELYGGTYENLIEMNPDTDPKDRRALLERACTVNGFQCLKIKDVVQEAQDSPDTFIFTVEFANPDGRLFTLGPCCGSTMTDVSPQSRFDFLVMRIPQLGNVLLVQTLPVYTP